MSIWILAAIIMLIAFLMTMTGRGGGNFYVLALVFAGYNMNYGVTSGQFILICSSLMASILFSKNKVNDWKLIGILGSLIFVSAIVGGYFGKYFPENILKGILAIFLFIAALLMLKKPKIKLHPDKKHILKFHSTEGTYYINLLVTIPAVLITGFVSGMVGISGGSFLVPLMILTMNVPMRIAVGTSTTLVTVSALAGFFGHLGAGFFDYRIAIPLAIGGVIGAFFGAKMAMKLHSKNLKYIFAGTQFVASILIIIDIISKL